MYTFVVSKGLNFVHRDADKCCVTGEHGVRNNNYIYMLRVFMYSQAVMSNS